VPTSEPDGGSVSTLTETRAEPATEQVTDLVVEDELLEPRPGVGFGLAAVLVAVVAVLLLAATAFVVATTYSPFIYFRF
jgi:hypothetical protein